MLYPALFASPRQLYGRKDGAFGFDRGLTLSVTGEFTVSKLAILAAAGAILAPSPIALAEPSGGIAEEAEAMLMRAAAAVKADKAKALDLFNKREGGFLDRDLYVFCVKFADGKEVAIGNPNTRKNLGNNIRAARRFRLARRLDRKSMRLCRSPKVKSLRSTMCGQGPALTRRQYRK